MTKFPGNLVRIIVLVSPMAAASFATGQTSGKDTFTAKCEMCHAADGAGSPLGKNLKAPDLRTPLIQKKNDAALSQVISQGKTNMPAFGTALSEDEIKEVIAYVRTLAIRKK